VVTVVRAYVLIQTEVGRTAGVATELKAIHGVSSSEAVTGPYDVIAAVEAANIDDLGKMIVVRIQGVDGVARTLTCPVIRI
jgi:DNA-binding Lrp family transcriptional regulator